MEVSGVKWPAVPEWGWHLYVQQCYFNYKCAYQVGNIVSFNNVVSNVSYIFLSFILYVIIIRYSDDDLNIREYYLITCVILSMFFEGIFSSVYHLCPSRVNLQFDTTFMFFFGILSIIYTLQKTRRNDLIDISKLFLFMASSKELGIKLTSLEKFSDKLSIFHEKMYFLKS